MTHSVFRTGLAIASAALAMAVTLPADAAKKASLPDIQVVGVDNVCESFTTTIDSSGNTTLTCVPVSNNPPPAGAPTGCVATINGTTLTSVQLTSAGGQATLLVSCASPSSGITYSWSKNGVFGASSSSSFNETFPANTSSSLPITTSYQVKACVNTACVTVPTIPLTVTVAASSNGGGPNPPPPGPNPSWNGSCPNFNRTIVLDLNWAAPGRVSSGGFGPSDIIVARFTTGNLDSASNNLPRVSGAEFGSPPSARFAVLSDTPCDFSPAQKQQGAVSAGNSIQVPFAVGLGNNWGFYPILQKNTTYYFNVKNLTPNESCSNQGICDMFIELSKPSGL